MPHDLVVTEHLGIPPRANYIAAIPRKNAGLTGVHRILYAP